MTTKIIFLGLNRISLSLGLALKKSEKLVERIGFDPDLSTQKLAIKMSAMDKIVETLDQRIQEADVILYALSAGKLKDVLRHIQGKCKPGCVLVNLELIGHDTFETISTEYADPRAHIAWVPAINPKYLDQDGDDPASACPDLFGNSHVYIAAMPDTNPEAIRLGGDLAVLTGAFPLYIDPDELAGIIALSHDYPRLISMVMTHLLTSDAGWNEARKLAAHDFMVATSAIQSYEPDTEPQISLHANRKNLQRLVAQTIERLQDLQTSLDDEEGQDLNQSIKNALLARQLWIKQRNELSWLEKGPLNPKAPHSITEALFRRPSKES